MIANIAHSYPDPLILAFFFFDFLPFFVLCVSPSYSTDFRGSAKRKTLFFVEVSLSPSPKKNKGWRCILSVLSVRITTWIASKLHVPSSGFFLAIDLAISVHLASVSARLASF